MTYLTSVAKTFIGFFVPFVIMALAIAAIHGPVSAPGIIALPGYSHGVVVCGEATTINRGHEADPQIIELLALAAQLCPAQ